MNASGDAEANAGLSPPRTSESAYFRTYYERIVVYAERRLAASRRRTADGEDVASMTLRSFFRRGLHEAPPPSPEDDWRRLRTIARRKVISHFRSELRKKRGGGRVRGESFFASANGADRPGLDGVADGSPTAEEALVLAEAVEALLAQLSEEEARVVAARLDGCSVAETAARLNLSLSSVERRLRLIRAKIVAYRAGDD